MNKTWSDGVPCPFGYFHRLGIGPVVGTHTPPIEGLWTGWCCMAVSRWVLGKLTVVLYRSTKSVRMPSSGGLLSPLITCATATPRIARIKNPTMGAALTEGGGQSQGRLFLRWQRYRTGSIGAVNDRSARLGLTFCHND